MRAKPDTQDLRQRRRFLKGLAAGSGVAALGLGAQPVSAEMKDERDEKEQTGYHETRHVSDYYRTTKF